MNTVQVSELPECNLCGAPAEYDTKTVWGPWAHLCEACFKKSGRPPTNKLEVVKHKEPKRTFDAVPMVRVPLSIDSVVTVKCPWCDQKRRVEVDANYFVDCEACGKPYKLISQV